jgi:pyridoxamine 5'-phosphate oxidase
VTKPEIIQFLNANPTCYLSTVEKDVPHVRALRMVRADEKGLIFQTVAGKDMLKQLQGNQNVEVCFFNPEKMLQVRVTGKAAFVDDVDLKKEILEQRPFLKALVEKKGFEAIPVFRLVGCVAHVWTMETNFLPKEYVSF